MQIPGTAGRRAPLVLVAAFAGCCVLVCPLMEVFRPRDSGALLVYFCFGAIAGAAGLLAIGSVLWSRPFWFRTLVGFAAGVLLYLFWLIGFTVSLLSRRHSAIDDDFQVCAAVTLCLPLVFLAVQAPLWLARILFRWDISGPHSPADPQSVRPLTIRDMLVGMGLIGLGLGAARVAQQLAEQGGSSPEEFWTAIGIAVASCMGISLASTLAIVVATLRVRKPALAMLGVGVYAVAALATTFAVIGFIEGSVPRPWEIIGMSTTGVTFAAAIATPLLLVRQHGFRLRWGRDAVSEWSPAGAGESISKTAEPLPQSGHSPFATGR